MCIVGDISAQAAGFNFVIVDFTFKIVDFTEWKL